MVPMAQQRRGPEVPPEQRERMVHWVRQAELVPPERRERLGQRARLELPVPKEQKARRAWLVAWSWWMWAWGRGHRQAWVPWGNHLWWLKPRGGALGCPRRPWGGVLEGCPCHLRKWNCAAWSPRR